MKQNKKSNHAKSQTFRAWSDIIHALIFCAKMSFAPEWMEACDRSHFFVKQVHCNNSNFHKKMSCVWSLTFLFCCHWWFWLHCVWQQHCAMATVLLLFLCFETCMMQNLKKNPCCSCFAVHFCILTFLCVWSSWSSTLLLEALFFWKRNWVVFPHCQTKIAPACVKMWWSGCWIGTKLVQI